MAFSEGCERHAHALEPVDDLLLYFTRGCLHNPTRDRGRVIGRATVVTAVGKLRSPITLAQRRFTSGCRPRLEGLGPFCDGVEVAPLTHELRSLPDPLSWSAWMRRPLVRLGVDDAVRLAILVDERESDLNAARATYIARANPKESLANAD